MDNQLTLWQPEDIAFRDYRSDAVLGVGLTGFLLFVALATVFAYQSVRVAYRILCLFLSAALSIVGLMFIVASQPLWLVFGVVLPRHLWGDAYALPPVSSEFTGETLEGGLFEVNPKYEVGGRRLPVSAHLECARLRRRTVWVRQLEAVLGSAPGVVGAFVKGRWTPDLPSNERSVGVNLALSHPTGGAKILGGGSVRGGTAGQPRRETYVVVELPDGSRETVFPELLGRLASYSLLRERNADLVSALRLRAQEWCKNAGLSSTVSWWAVCSAIKLAWPVSTMETSVSGVVGVGMSTTSFPGLA